MNQINNIFYRTHSPSRKGWQSIAFPSTGTLSACLRITPAVDTRWLLIGQAAGLPHPIGRYLLPTPQAGSRTAVIGQLWRWRRLIGGRAVFGRRLRRGRTRPCVVGCAGPRHAHVPGLTTWLPRCTEILRFQRYNSVKQILAEVSSDRAGAKIESIRITKQEIGIWAFRLTPNQFLLDKIITKKTAFHHSVAQTVCHVLISSIPNYIKNTPDIFRNYPASAISTKNPA